MKSAFLRQKYRYFIGFGLLAVFAILFASYHFWQIPDGLSLAEMNSAAVAGHLSPLGLIRDFPNSLSDLINLPWTLLEWLSFHLFGMTTFAMRLPAVILSLGAVAALIVVFCRWQRANIGLIAGFAIVASTAFMGLARTAIPGSMTIFLLSFIIMIATLIMSAKRSSWRTVILKIILCISGALLVYSPGGIYLIGALGLAGILHPKTRLALFRARPWKIIVAIAAGLIVLSPLAIGAISQLISGNFALIRELLVLDGAFSLQNLQTLGGALVGVAGEISGGLIVPVISIVGLVIALMGLAKLIRDIISARSYLILSLILTSLILAISHPNMIYLLFVPLALAMSVGFAALIDSWYRLFPINPYARITALIPLAILIVGVGWTNVARYFDYNLYDANVVYHYSQEFQAVRETLATAKQDTILVVPSRDKAFYDALKLRSNYPIKEVIADDNFAKNRDKNNTIILGSANAKIDSAPTRIVTNSRTRDAVLLRIY